MADPLFVAYRKRWEAVKQIEIQEQQAASIEQRWQQLNALMRLANGLSLHPDQNDEMDLQVYNRWAKLKRAG